MPLQVPLDESDEEVNAPSHFEIASAHRLQAFIRILLDDLIHTALSLFILASSILAKTGLFTSTSFLTGLLLSSTSCLQTEARLLLLLAASFLGFLLICGEQGYKGTADCTSCTSDCTSCSFEVGLLRSFSV